MKTLYDKTKCTSPFLKGYSGCGCTYCTEFSNQKGKWILNIHGTAEKGHEISMVRETNRHGIASWGWDGKHKIITSSNSNRGIPKIVFNAIKAATKKLISEKNKKEST